MAQKAGPLTTLWVLAMCLFAAYACSKLPFVWNSTGPDGDKPLYLASTLRETGIFDSEIKVVGALGLSRPDAQCYARLSRIRSSLCSHTSLPASLSRRCLS